MLSPSFPDMAAGLARKEDALYPRGYVPRSTCRLVRECAGYHCLGLQLAKEMECLLSVQLLRDDSNLNVRRLHRHMNSGLTRMHSLREVSEEGEQVCNKG